MSDHVERLKHRALAIRGVLKSTPRTRFDADLLDEAAAEILRLREENARIRKETIEEAAKIAETGDWYGQFQTAGDERRAQSIAARIRSLPVEEEKR